MTAERLKYSDGVFTHAEQIGYACPRCGVECETLHDEVYAFFCEKDSIVSCLASGLTVDGGHWGMYDGIDTRESFFYLIIDVKDRSDAVALLDMIASEK